jgi:5-methylcytosine-specific restriction endonuclease McrA
MAKPEYSGPEWRAVRLVVLARDGYRCQIRGPKCRIVATHVDHIRSISQGGSRLDPGNLRAACASCNIAKRNREVAARARGVSTTGGVNEHTRDWDAPPGEVGVRCRYYGTNGHVCGHSEDPYGPRSEDPYG